MCATETFYELNLKTYQHFIYVKGAPIRPPLKYSKCAYHTVADLLLINENGALR